MNTYKIYNKDVNAFLDLRTIFTIFYLFKQRPIYLI